MNRYVITETISKDYIVYADTFDEALAKAFDIDETWDFDESSQGFTYIYETETGKDLCL